MGLSLIAFDTDHIKRYVFGTNKLKEIRGASSLLDYLNRIVMLEKAEKHNALTIFANGGSGLFLVESDKAHQFGQDVQRAFADHTGGYLSVTCVHQPLPERITGIGDEDIGEALELLQWRLQEAKLRPPTLIALPSHPFMHPCSACGIEYADAGHEGQRTTPDPDDEDELEEDNRYCKSCQKKRDRDGDVKAFVKQIIKGQDVSSKEYLWNRMLPLLRKEGYDLPERVQRPRDFNVFRNFKGAKDYLGLIYADANNMGKAIGDHRSLAGRQKFATAIDDAIYEAVSIAIARHLKIADLVKPVNDLNRPTFPFDILLLGGDDVVMVTPASRALDVALTIAEEFRKLTNEKHSLSVGVVLAPIKYPFGLLRSLADSTLKFAKDKGADARARGEDDARINFMIVTGGSSSDFKSIYNIVYYQKSDNPPQEFHATLRPYTPNDLRTLLSAIREGNALNLGRTKLHQLREAVLHMNLTTAVSEGMAILNNWRERQRLYVVRQVYEFGGRYQMPRSDPDDLKKGFPQITFPWFVDTTQNNGSKVYRTSLLDYVELYDFIAKAAEDERDEN